MLKITKEIRRKYIVDHPIALALGVASLICPLYFFVFPEEFKQFSINFLPSFLEAYWLSLWLAAGGLITYGIARLNIFAESLGFLILSSVIFAYSIALISQGQIASLILLGVVPAVAAGSLTRAILGIITFRRVQRIQKLRKENKS